MANIKSSKKRVLQTEKKRLKNAARKSSIKTGSKAVLDAITQGKDAAVVKSMLVAVEAKLSRAKNKGVFHKNTAARKIGRLARRVAAYEKSSVAVA